MHMQKHTLASINAKPTAKSIQYNRFREGKKTFVLFLVALPPLPILSMLPCCTCSAVNPNDTEEVIWALLCDAKTEGVGFEAARRQLLKDTT